MKKLITALVAAAAGILVLGAGAGAGDPTTFLNQEATPTVVTATALVTALDPTLTDTAVTDSDLATSGVTTDSIVSLLDDPNMLIVDDDKVQCPNAQFTTISSAVLVAPPGATIRVCPGLYKESVLIDKPLTLQAPRQQGQATECKSPVADDPTQEAIVEYNASLNGGNPSEGFDVQAPNVTIDGFKVEPNPSIVTHDGVGIFTVNAFSGYDIRHNVLQNNTIGAYFNSSGAQQSLLRENCFRNNILTGAAGGNGVYTDEGIRNSQIENNYFTGDFGAIVIDTFLSTPMNVEVSHNESVNDGSIAVFDSANMTIDYNKVIGSDGSGVVTGALAGGAISYNDVENGTFNGISLHSTTGVVVKSNKAIGFKLSGVRLADQSNNNTVSTNRAENNGHDGLEVTGQSSGNTIQENHMKANAMFDCYDDTAGTGTALTANFWINDTGYSESKPGLCKHASP